MSKWTDLCQSIARLIDEGEIEKAWKMLEEAQEESSEEPTLHLLRGDILWDKGESREALAAYERALSLAPDSMDCKSVVAMVMFELLEFNRAREIAAGALEVADPQDTRRAGLYDLLSQLSERDGAYEDSDRMAALAADADPEDYPRPCRLTEAEFQKVADRAIEILPEEFLRALKENLAIVIEPVPSIQLLTADDPPLPPTLLGLYAGIPLPERQSSTDPPSLPDVIHLFQRNIEREASDEEEIARQIAVTVYHEIGHYFGMDESELDALDLG